MTAPAMEPGTDTTGRRAHGDIDRLLARIRALVRTREARRRAGAGDAEVAATSAEIGRLQARLAEAVRRQLGAAGEGPAPRPRGR